VAGKAREPVKLLPTLYCKEGIFPQHVDDGRAFQVIDVEWIDSLFIKDGW
jgi:hypothetical protein